MRFKKRRSDQSKCHHHLYYNTEAYLSLVTWLTEGNHGLRIGSGSRIVLLVLSIMLSKWPEVSRRGLLDQGRIRVRHANGHSCCLGRQEPVPAWLFTDSNLCPVLVSGGTLSHKWQPLLSQACSPQNYKQEDPKVGWNSSLCGSPVATVVCPHALPRAQLLSDWSKGQLPLYRTLAGCFLPQHYLRTS